MSSLGTDTLAEVEAEAEYAAALISKAGAEKVPNAREAERSTLMSVDLIFITLPILSDFGKLR